MSSACYSPTKKTKQRGVCWADGSLAPKGNSYQSLHTTVIGPENQRIEIQIRTQEMHEIAEYGIAAHWHYKEGRQAELKLPPEQLKWITELLQWQKEISDNEPL